MREKRKFIRLEEPMTIYYKPIRKNKRSKRIAAWSRDISGGGIRIQASELLKNGDFLDIEVELPNLKNPVRVTGEVVWQKSGEAGVLFRDVAPKELHRIFEYIYTIGISQKIDKGESCG